MGKQSKQKVRKRKSLSKCIRSFQVIPSYSKMSTEAIAAFIETEVEKRVAERLVVKNAEIVRLNTVIAGLNAQLQEKKKATLLTPKAFSAVPVAPPFNPFDAMDGTMDGGNTSDGSSGYESGASKKSKKKPRVGAIAMWPKKVERDGAEYVFDKAGDEYYLDGEKIDNLKGPKLRDAEGLLFGHSLGRTTSRMAPTNDLLIKIVKKKMDKMEAGDTTWEPKVDFENTVQQTDELWREMKMYKKMNSEDVAVATGTLSVKRVGMRKEVVIVSAPSAVANLLNIQFKSLGIMQKMVTTELAKLDLLWRSPDETMSSWRVKRDGVEKSLEEMYTEYALTL